MSSFSSISVNWYVPPPSSTYTKSLKDLNRDELIQLLYLVEQSTPIKVNSKQGKLTTPL